MSNEEIASLNAKKHKLELQDQVLRDEYDILALDKNLLLKNRDLKGNADGLKVAELKEAFAFMHLKLTEINTRQTAIYNQLEDLSKEMRERAISLKPQLLQGLLPDKGDEIKDK